jgi:hypothetical protein
MRNGILAVALLALLPVLSCEDVSMELPRPTTMAGIGRVYTNVPMELVSYSIDSGATTLAPTHGFYMRATQWSIAGSDGCIQYGAGYSVSWDSVTIGPVGTTHDSCTFVPAPKAASLEGAWQVSTSDTGVRFTGTRGFFEFSTAYSAPVERLPIVSRQWVLVESDDSVVTGLQDHFLYPRLYLASERIVSLHWVSHCFNGEPLTEVFYGAYGVNRSGGILMKFTEHYGCEFGSPRTDNVVWPFVFAFFECSRYTTTNTSLVFQNTKRHTYYRFVAER